MPVDDMLRNTSTLWIYEPLDYERQETVAAALDVVEGLILRSNAMQRRANKCKGGADSPKMCKIFH